MKTIAVIGQKGGCGKSTIAIALAVAAAQSGKATAVIDLDPQANAANWHDRRNADTPAVVSAQVSRLRQTLEAARLNGADLAILDTPGKSDSAAIEAARAADLVLVPVRPQIFDLETLASIRDLLRVAGDPQAYVVLNALHPSARRMADHAKEITAKASAMKVCPVHLSHRAAYAEAPASGHAAQELQPDGAAAREIDQLFQFALQHVHMIGGSNGKRVIESTKRTGSRPAQRHQA